MINLFYIIFALSFHYKINLIGDFYFAQILIILISIYFFFNKSDKLNLIYYEKIILILIVLWQLNQLISDHINEIGFNDSARGNVKIIITFLSFYSFFKISKLNNISLIKILFWICVVNILFMLFNLNNLTFINNWKFFGGTSISISLIILFNFYYKKFFTNNLLLVLIFGIGILSLFYETRYLFLFNVLFVFYIILFEKFNIKKIIPITIISIFFYFLMLNIYGYFITYELLPEALLQKQIAQNSRLGILLGGRGEIFSSVIAIKDAPLLGHGSWAKDCEYIYAIYDQKFQYNPDIKLDLTRCLIKTHSVIFGSWVNSGIFGFIFWFYIIISIIKKLLKVISTEKISSSLFVYLAISLFWDILFSPYGATRMVYAPLCIVIILITNKKINSF